jgi:hypothetical protein
MQTTGDNQFFIQPQQLGRESPLGRAFEKALQCRSVAKKMPAITPARLVFDLREADWLAGGAGGSSKTDSARQHGLAAQGELTGSRFAHNFGNKQHGSLPELQHVVARASMSHVQFILLNHPAASCPANFMYTIRRRVPGCRKQYHGPAFPPKAGPPPRDKVGSGAVNRMQKGLMGKPSRSSGISRTFRSRKRCAKRAPPSTASSRFPHFLGLGVPRRKTSSRVKPNGTYVKCDRWPHAMGHSRAACKPTCAP